ncbi:MAG: hypothetical protein RL681_665 [Candidatus Parcubacteria bacterium]|jgi:hypothetical protein
MLVDELQPLPFFNGLVRDATKRQRAPLSELMMAYLAEMLASLMADEDTGRGHWAIPSRPLIELLFDAELRKARSRYDPEALWTFQVVGNASLVLLGFFRESHTTSLLGSGNIMHVGRRAYAGVGVPPFSDLAGRFPYAASVLREVGIRCALKNDSSLARIYGSWRQNPEPLVTRMLTEAGVLGPRN